VEAHLVTMTESRPMYRAGPECPDCHSADVVPILYGYPSAAAYDAAARGELLLGGCILEPTNPRCSCRSCGRRFNHGDVTPGT
jgi:hypothetical protein